MNKSDSIAKLSLSLVKAQGEMPVVKQNSVNPFLKNKYADLGAVIETSRPILAKHGLAIVQFPVSVEDKIGVTSTLIHESGEWIEDTIFISVSDGKGLSSAQNSGVVISYLRRYSWSSILGLYADEDTDGGHPKPEAKTSEPTSKPKAEPMTLERAQAMTTADGKKYGDLTRADLDRIKDNAAAPEEKKQAARLLIAQLIKEGK